MIRLILFLVLFFHTGLISSDFRTGDIIFRQENTILSTLFSAIENSKYAHVGVLLTRGKNVYVIHTELADGQDGLRVQKLNEFLKNSKQWMTMRYGAKIDNAIMEATLEKYIRLKPKFNTSFEVGAKDKMYCTEFVQEIYKEATGFILAKTTSNYLGKRFISTKDIYSNPSLVVVIKSK